MCMRLAYATRQNASVCALTPLLNRPSKSEQNFPFAKSSSDMLISANRIAITIIVQGFFSLSVSLPCFCQFINVAGDRVSVFAATYYKFDSDSDLNGAKIAISSRVFGALSLLYSECDGGRSDGCLGFCHLILSNDFPPRIARLLIFLWFFHVLLFLPSPVMSSSVDLVIESSFCPFHCFIYRRASMRWR